VLPDALRAALDARAADAAPSPDLELLVAGGFLPLALARGARARLADQVFSHYGATELFGGVMQQRFEHPEDLHWLTPNPARRIEVADEAGQVCAIGVEGDLRVEVEAHDIAAYLDDPEATAQCFRDGFFHPGDRAVRRADGRIRVLGRAVDVINLAGQKRAVAPIERSLEEALDVEEVCLFSHLADDGVEEVVVAVQSRAPRDPAQLARALGGSADFGRVRVAVFEAFPRTAGGHAKTNRVALRAMLLPRPAPG
jgi:acyl-coenzyme A synthetase/AMP-(fatty) acid ligase